MDTKGSIEEEERGGEEKDAEGILHRQPYSLTFPQLLVMLKNARHEYRGRCFFLSKKSLPSMRSQSGYWKETENGFTAIGEGSSSSPAGRPSYHGVRRTLEFYMNNGYKTGWSINEYQLFHYDENNHVVFRKDGRVFCKVFHNKPGPDLQGGVQDPSEGRPRGREASSASAGERLPPTPAGRNNRESKVWQNFTKIHTEDDPDAVYAACHCCDRVFPAHPKKHGTSHLRRHHDKCSSHNPPSPEDEEIIRQLRRANDLYKQQEMNSNAGSQEVINADIAKRDPDPRDLQPTSSYITSSLSRETDNGCWKEKLLIAIRIDQLPPWPRPHYGGLRTTLKWYHRESTTKMNWIMHQYQLLDVDEYKPNTLILQGALVSRKVFNKDVVPDQFMDLDVWLNADEEEDYQNGGVHEDDVQAYAMRLQQDCLLTDSVQGDQSRPGKRKRTSAPNGGSQVWMHFTKVTVIGSDRVYAVCHCCDKGYNGESKNGTSSLWRHNMACLRKSQELPRHSEAGIVNGIDARREAVWAFAVLRCHEGTGE